MNSLVCYDVSSTSSDDDQPPSTDAVSNVVNDAAKPPPGANPGDFFFDSVGFRDIQIKIEPQDSASEAENEDSVLSSGDNSRASSRLGNSDDSDYVYERIAEACRKRKETFKPPLPPKTKGELSVDDLPKIENLQISLPDNIILQKLGEVSSIVNTLVVVFAETYTPALDEDTLLFTGDRNSVGKIFETFGPVVRPYYSIRFNSSKDVVDSGLCVGTCVFFAPHSTDFTRSVFALHDLMRQRGSDASWMDNNEPPPKELEFSDDEQEKSHRRALRLQRRQARQAQRAESADEVLSTSSSSGDEGSSETRGHKRKRAGAATRGRGRGTFRGRQTHLQGEARSDSHSGTAAVGRYNQLVQNSAVMDDCRSFRPRLAWPPRNAPFLPRSHADSMRIQRVPQMYFPAGQHGQPQPQSHDWMWMSEGVFRHPPPMPLMATLPRANRPAGMPMMPRMGSGYESCWTQQHHNQMYYSHPPPPPPPTT